MEAVLYSSFLFFFFFFFWKIFFFLCCSPAASPWHLPTFPLQRRVCEPGDEEQISLGEQMKELVKTEGKIRGSARRLARGRSPSADNRPTQQLAGLREKSTRRSHYCPPSSVFTGMLKIVITSVRTEISNFDVFVEGLRPSCGEEETESKRSRIWHSRMRGGTAFGPR